MAWTPCIVYRCLYNNQINARALIGQSAMVYLQVNALSERIIRIYLHEFTNNERENSIPHEAAECGIENFEFIVSERVQVNPDNSRAMSAFLLFKLNTLQTKIVKL